MFFALLHALPYFSVGFATVLALGELLALSEGLSIVRGSTRYRQLLRVWILISAAILLLHGQLLVTREIYTLPLFFGWQIVAGLLFAPALLRYFQLRLPFAGNTPSSNWRFWRLAALPAVAMALFQLGRLAFDAVSPDIDPVIAARARIDAFFAGRGLDRWFIAASALHFAGYMFAAIFIRRRLLAAPLLAGGFALVALAIVAALVGGRELLFQSAVLAIAVCVPLLYLLARVQPEFFEEWLWRLERAALAKEARRKSNASPSRLGAGSDPVALKDRLARLMDAEELYLQEELSADDLAAHLNLSGYQLSELLNRHLGLSFFQYVNGLRVQAACRLLRSEPNTGVLEIAFRSGFNSKSAFQRAFQRQTGLSPREWRRSAGQLPEAAGD